MIQKDLHQQHLVAKSSWCVPVIPGTGGKRVKAGDAASAMLPSPPYLPSPYSPPSLPSAPCLLPIAIDKVSHCPA